MVVQRLRCGEHAGQHRHDVFARREDEEGADGVAAGVEGPAAAAAGMRRLLGEQGVEFGDDFVRVFGEGGADVAVQGPGGAGDGDVRTGRVEHYLGDGDHAA